MFIFQLILFGVLFLFSMVFSAAEAALTALSTLRMKRMSLVRPALRPALAEWLDHPHRLLVTLLVGNNFVNVAASSLFYAMALPLAAYVPQNLLSVLLWLAATALFVAGGEVFPKIIGRAYRERMCEFLLPPLTALKRWLFFVWGPVGWVIQKTVPRLAQNPVNPLMVVSLEELHHALTESESAGRVAPDQAAMIRRAMTLHEKCAGDILQPAEKVDGLTLDLLGGRRGADFWIDALIESGRTRVPVFRKGRAEGYINVMDLAVASSPAIESLLRPLRRVSPDRKVLDLLLDFKASGDPIAAVESDGRFLGLVTLEDVLEEVVGEILDEYDAEKRK